MNRGTLHIEVHAGLRDILTRTDLGGAAVVLDAVGNPLQRDADGRYPSAGDAGRIVLAGVRGVPEISTLLRQAPTAIWSATADEDTAIPNTWTAWHPETGLLEGAWLDGQVMVPASWLDPSTRDEHATRWITSWETLTRLRADPLAGLDPATGTSRPFEEGPIR